MQERLWHLMSDAEPEPKLKLASKLVLTVSVDGLYECTISIIH